MAEIEVERTGGGDGDKLSFNVTVTDSGSDSRHEVTVSQSDYERLRNGGEQPEQFVERCFYFLLEREPREAILSSFDITEISRYFPEFEQEISG